MYQQREDFPGTANVWLAYAGVSTCIKLCMEDDSQKASTVPYC